MRGGAQSISFKAKLAKSNFVEESASDAAGQFVWKANPILDTASEANEWSRRRNIKAEQAENNIFLFIILRLYAFYGLKSSERLDTIYYFKSKY